MPASPSEKGMKKSRVRNATLDEIAACLRNAGDYLGAMVKHEKAASDATEEAIKSKDWGETNEAARQFARDFDAFANAARTAWNFMIQLANETGSRDWLEGRTKSHLFALHRELTNQAVHKYGMVFGIQQKVKVEGMLPVPLLHTPYGPVAPSGPLKMDLNVVGLENMAYQHNPNNLEPDVAELCRSVLKRYPNATVVELGARYLDELRQVFKSGERRSRFTIVPTETPSE
jgi:hypothetical protein